MLSSINLASQLCSTSSISNTRWKAAVVVSVLAAAVSLAVTAFFLANHFLNLNILPFSSYYTAIPASVALLESLDCIFALIKLYNSGKRNIKTPLLNASKENPSFTKERQAPEPDKKVSQTAPILPVASKPQQEVTRATVYIHTPKTGPIRNDCCYDFASRLKDVHGKPVPIRADDFYVKLEQVSVEKRRLEILDKSGLSTCYTYLPASLFTGVKEGEVVRFYLDEQLVELTCCQAAHPNPRAAETTFENYLDFVRGYCRYNRTQALWSEDIEGAPQFMDQLIGEDNYKVDSKGNSIKADIGVFASFEQDQVENGPYQMLKATEYDTAFVFDIHTGHEIDLEEIELIESKGFNGLHQLWIVIPHQQISGFRSNQFPEGTTTIVCGYGDDTKKTFTKDSYDPKKGDRMPLYPYGQYFLFKRMPSSSFSLSYNARGWLEIKFLPVES